MRATLPIEDIASELASRGHAGRDLLARFRPADWRRFQRAWDGLGRDPYLDARCGVRERRYGCLELDEQGRLVSAPRRAHLQAPAHNRLFGGLARWFAPLRAEFLASPVTGELGRLWRGALGAGQHAVELHQFRVLPWPRTASPTPEGWHRDGHDAVFMLLVERRDVLGGESLLWHVGRSRLERAGELQPGTALFLDDAVMRHRVTDIVRSGPRARRDCLVACFRRMQGAGRAEC